MKPVLLMLTAVLGSATLAFAEPLDCTLTPLAHVDKNKSITVPAEFCSSVLTHSCFWPSGDRMVYECHVLQTAEHQCVCKSKGND